MNAFITAGLVAVGLCLVAIWIEIRERPVAVGDGNYRSNEKKN